MTTPREQQLHDALSDIVQMVENYQPTMWSVERIGSVAKRALLTVPPPEEKTCETCVSGPTDCHQCCPDVVDHSNWQPKPVAPEQMGTCNDCAHHDDDCESMASPRRLCWDDSRNPMWQPNPVAPVEDKESTKHCVLCPMPETSGALYPMGDELWCGTCCASEVRRLRATPRYAPTRDDCVSILDDRAFLRMLDCAALANPAIRQATCSYAEGVLAERKRREKGGGR